MVSVITLYVERWLLDGTRYGSDYFKIYASVKSNHCASNSITSWQMDVEKMETVTDYFI